MVQEINDKIIDLSLQFLRLLLRLLTYIVLSTAQLMVYVLTQIKVTILYFYSSTTHQNKESNSSHQSLKHQTKYVSPKTAIMEKVNKTHERLSEFISPRRVNLAKTHSTAHSNKVSRRLKFVYDQEYFQQAIQTDKLVLQNLKSISVAEINNLRLAITHLANNELNHSCLNNVFLKRINLDKLTETDLNLWLKMMVMVKL